MIPTIAFIGHQGSGKTTLLIHLLPRLRERGLRVGIVKHAPSEVQLDQPGKDSALFQKAGVERTLVLTDSHGAVFFKLSTETSLVQMVDRIFQGFDLVLVEGFKRGPFPKVEVYRRLSQVGPGAEPLAGTIDVIAVVTDERVALPDGVALLSPHRLEEVVDFLEQVIL